MANLLGKMCRLRYHFAFFRAIDILAGLCGFLTGYCGFLQQVARCWGIH